MSALSTRLTRAAPVPAASTARRTTSITSSHSPSMLVNIAFVSLGRPDSRTTRTAAATASLTLSESPPAGATLNATSMVPMLALLASPTMAARRPLPFDPIARATELWSDRIGPPDTMAAVTSIMRVHQIVLAAVEPALRPLGLTFARYEGLVLLSFSRSGTLPMRVMGERLQLHPTSDTTMGDRVAAAGLVRRAPHPTDGRTTLVSITDEGRTKLETATKAVVDVEFGLVGLTVEQQRTLTARLTSVRGAAGDFAADDLGVPAAGEPAAAGGLGVPDG